MFAFVYIEGKNAEIYLTGAFFNNYFADIMRHELPEQTMSTCFMLYQRERYIYRINCK